MYMWLDLYIQDIVIRALAWILAYINFVRIFCVCMRHTYKFSLCSILVCIHVNRQTRWNIEYHLQKHRNTSYAYPAFSLCASSVIYLYACIRVSRKHIETSSTVYRNIGTHTRVVTSTTERRKHGYLSGGGLYACCRCKLAPWYRLRNRTRSHCMNIICIQVGYMAGAGISWLARINDYMEPTDVGGPATPRLALYLLRPPIPPRRLRYH